MGTDDVVQRAAELAGLYNYEVVELYPLAFPPPEETDDDDNYDAVYTPAPIDEARLWAVPTDLAPGLYYRHYKPFSQ